MDLSVYGSDQAAGLMMTVVDNIMKSLEKGLKEPGNEFNTDGYLNVAMILDEFFLNKKIISTLEDNDKYPTLLKKLIKNLKEQIKLSSNADWDTEINKHYHINKYKKLLKKLRFALNKVENG